MLPDRIGQLLTAYVDGELSARRRKAVERLLQQSAEARALCAQLQQTAGLLRRLPPQAPGRDLSGPVLSTIAERRLHPARRAALAPQPAFPAWVGLATAAAVLIIITVSSFLFFSAVTDHDARGRDVAKGKATAKSGEAQPADRPSSVVADKQPQTPPRPRGPAVSPPPPDAVVRQTPHQAVPKEPPLEPSDDTLGSPEKPDPKLEVFEALNLRSALNVPVHSLNEPNARRRLRESLKTAAAYRVELTCLPNGGAFKAIEGVLEGQGGVHLLVDHLAKVRLKDHSLRTDYVLYCECLTAEELARLLEQLAAGDAKIGSRKQGRRQFADLVVEELGKEDHARLSALLGVDPTLLQPPEPKAPLGVDVRKPISQATADELARTLAGQGVPRPAGQTKPATPTDRQAVALACNPVRRSPASSTEVKQFLAGRKARRPGALQLLLILRGANG
jgi:hypothetical protein